MRVVFMGTPDFAVGSLQALAESGKYDIAAVVTQPDRPKGRGRKIVMSPVKEYALMHGYEVYQPERIKKFGVCRGIKKTVTGYYSCRCFWSAPFQRYFGFAALRLY